MAGPGNILIRIGADASQAVRELGTTDKALGKTMTTSEKMGAGIKKAALPAAVALGAIGFAAIGATKAAMEDAAAQEHLAGVLKRTTGATDAQVKATEDWITSDRPRDRRRPTTSCVRRWKPSSRPLASVSKAQKDMKAALDISAASGKSLQAVTKAMAFAHTGQTAKLEKLVPGLSAAAKESDNMNVIMKELGEKTTGGDGRAGGDGRRADEDHGEPDQRAEGILRRRAAAGGQGADPAAGQVRRLRRRKHRADQSLVVVVAALAGAILVANAAMKAYAAGRDHRRRRQRSA